MLSFLPSQLIGFLSFIIYCANTVFWVVPIVIFSLLKALIPIRFWQKAMSYLLDNSASAWVGVNTLIQKLFINMKINVSPLTQLTKDDWYLVVSNHQSWVDIVILQRLLHGKIPFLKFFLKKELIFVPFLGIAWWALDFPFMKRYSQAFLRKNPHLIGSDFETTRKACEKFKHKPVSVMNFIEGTRFTAQKKTQQNSPYQYLLRPKAGGVALALGAMGEYFTKLVNVTIYYPEGKPTFTDFLCGRIKQVEVDVQVTAIDERMVGDYYGDKKFKQGFQVWLNQLWLEKDQKLIEFNQASKLNK
ncbi:MAG: acyltransferase [Thalassotalea sp.]